jgi:transposase InsO family protein
MTEVLVQGCGGRSRVVGRDGWTTPRVGHDAGLPGRLPQGLAAREMAGHRPGPPGVRGQGLSGRRDHGWPPTAMAFIQACRHVGRPQALTSAHQPQGQAETERVMRPRTEECLWLKAWRGPFELIHALACGITSDTAHDVHAALGAKPPRPFAQAYHPSPGTPCTAA